MITVYHTQLFNYVHEHSAVLNEDFYYVVFLFVNAIINFSFFLSLITLSLP
jgi:hypothetical protein